MVKPEGVAEDWEKTDLWRSAEAIPGVCVVCDVGGLEARLFGATTSGQAMLFDDGGKLLFNGGITFARGHAGDNSGREAVEHLVQGQPYAIAETPAFGCPLSSGTEP
jgi:hypothetical protein